MIHWTQAAALAVLAILILVKVWTPAKLSPWKLRFELVALGALALILLFIPRRRGALKSSTSSAPNNKAPAPGAGAQVEEDTKDVDELVEEVDGVGVGDLHDRVERWRQRTREKLQKRGGGGL